MNRKTQVQAVRQTDTGASSRDHIKDLIRECFLPGMLPPVNTEGRWKFPTVTLGVAASIIISCRSSSSSSSSSMNNGEKFLLCSYLPKDPSLIVVCERRFFSSCCAEPIYEWNGILDQSPTPTQHTDTSTHKINESIFRWMDG